MKKLIDFILQYCVRVVFAGIVQLEGVRNSNFLSLGTDQFRNKSGTEGVFEQS